MSRFIIVAFLVVVAIAVCSAQAPVRDNPAKEECPKGKFRTIVGANFRRLRCSDPEDPLKFTLRKGPLCVCHDGYLETDDGKCVRKDKCPKQ